MRFNDTVWDQLLSLPSFAPFHQDGCQEFPGLRACFPQSEQPQQTPISVSGSGMN